MVYVDPTYSLRTVSGTLLLVYHLRMGCAHVHMSTHPEDVMWDASSY